MSEAGIHLFLEVLPRNFEHTRYSDDFRNYPILKEKAIKHLSKRHYYVGYMVDDRGWFKLSVTKGSNDWNMEWIYPHIVPKHVRMQHLVMA